MKRRDFLKTSALAVAGLPRSAFQPPDTRKRVGLIGSGWYGKCDLFLLIQVAPVEVARVESLESEDLGAEVALAEAAVGIAELLRGRACHGVD